MDSLEDETDYFRSKLKNYLKQNSLSSLPDGYIGELTSKDPAFPFLTDEQREQINRSLETSFKIRQTFSTAVLSDYEPWLYKRRQEKTDSKDWFYSKRLEKYLFAEKILPPGVIPTLNKDTDDILDYCGDPEDKGAWSRRGMVMGHVQFGKTTNYSMLISKAADVGYKYIIILAGLTNSLRYQTQKRIDEAFIGIISDQSIAKAPLPITEYNSYDTKKRPNYATGRTYDFGKKAEDYLGGFLADNIKDSLVFVMKKNPKTLEALNTYFEKENKKFNEPLLLIDDEADNASVNTKKNIEQQTKINGLIRSLLNQFTRSSYIGYTATPFANIFIQPENYSDAVGDDLFPKHFIVALEVPTGDPPNDYVGSARVFREDGDLFSTMVKVVEEKDYNDLLPLNHKIEDPVVDLPSSLKDATRVFLLTRAIRYLLGQNEKHCSMMINVSRFNIIQTKVENLVIKYFNKLKNSIFENAKIKGFNNDKILQQFEKDYNEEFYDCGFTFNAILDIFALSISSIQIQTVNMQKKNALDYEAEEKKGGLHVIAIGGLALSRGLTLEGLTVSYILRNTNASDTLMQMARWFGYRIGYQKLCRVYLPKTSLEHYQYVDESIEDLRSDIKEMKRQGKTPEDFGLKVLQSDLATKIRITAANKMRAGTSITLVTDLSGKHTEGHYIYNDTIKNSKNWDLVDRFLKQFNNYQNGTFGACKYLTKIKGQSIIELVENFDFPVALSKLGRYHLNSSLFLDFIKERISSEYSLWDLALVHNQKNVNPQNIFGFNLTVRSRGQNDFEDNSICKINRNKNRVAQPGDESILMSKDQIQRILDKYNDIPKDLQISYGKKICANLLRPLILIHPFNETSGDPKSKINGLNVGLSFCLPNTKIEPKEKTYVVNQTYLEQMKLATEEPGDDEEYQLNDNY